MAAAGARAAALALLVLVAALVHDWPRLVPLPLLALGGLYAVQLRVDAAPLDPAAAGVAAGLLVTAELAYWSLEEREGFHAEAGERLRRTARIAALGLAALLVAWGLLVLADAVRARGLALDLAGATAAAGVLLALALRARAR